MQMKVRGRTDYKLSRKRTGGRDFAIFLTDVFGNDSVSRVCMCFCDLSSVIGVLFVDSL